MKAFLVTEPEEGTGGIIFAKSAIEARRLGANEWNDGELAGMRVERAKGLDCYHGTGVPARILVAQGWHFECTGCGMNIEDWSLEDADLSIDGVIGNENSRVYCSAPCKAKSDAQEAREKQAGNTFIEALREQVRLQFGSVPFGRTHAYAVERNGEVFVEQAIVEFEFPGMKFGPASLRYDPCNFYGIGPVRPEYSCCNGDRDAFEAFARDAMR